MVCEGEREDYQTAPIHALAPVTPTARLPTETLRAQRARANGQHSVQCRPHPLHLVSLTTPADGLILTAQSADTGGQPAQSACPAVSEVVLGAVNAAGALHTCYTHGVRLRA